MKDFDDALHEILRNKLIFVGAPHTAQKAVDLQRLILKEVEKRELADKIHVVLEFIDFKMCRFLGGYLSGKYG